MNTKRHPKAFMSYSHDSDEHIEWVAELSTRLRSAGIEVIFDQWDLDFGQDITMFMEESVTNADWVLLICTEQYTLKANDRKGGVGYESMIVTGELAENLPTSKFIPIVKQLRGEPSLPKWLRTRLYADLSNSERYEQNFKSLVAQIHNYPRRVKPPLGPIPINANVNSEGGLSPDNWRLTLTLYPEHSLSIPKASLFDCLLKSCCSLPLAGDRRFTFPLFRDRSNQVGSASEGWVGAKYKSHLAADEEYTISQDGSARLTIQQTYASSARAVQGDVVLTGVAHFWPFVTRFWRQYPAQMHFLHLRIEGISGALLSLNTSLYVAINLISADDYDSGHIAFLPASGVQGLTDLLLQTFHNLAIAFSPKQGISKSDFDQNYLRAIAERFLKGIIDAQSTDESPCGLGE